MWPNDFSFNEYETHNLVFFQMKREKELSIGRKGKMGTEPRSQEEEYLFPPS